MCLYVCMYVSAGVCVCVRACVFVWVCVCVCDTVRLCVCTLAWIVKCFRAGVRARMCMRLHVGVSVRPVASPFAGPAAGAGACPIFTARCTAPLCPTGGEAAGSAARPAASRRGPRPAAGPSSRGSRLGRTAETPPVLASGSGNKSTLSCTDPASRCLVRVRVRVHACVGVCRWPASTGKACPRHR